MTKCINNSSIGALAIAMVPLVLLGCADVNEQNELDNVGATTQPLYVLSTALWNTNILEVCWTDSGYVNEKAWVKDAITRSWQAFIDIEFTGWGDCPSNMSDFVGIAIEPGTSNVVRNGLGQQSDNISEMELDFSASPQSTWTRCVNNSLNREDCIRATATHEFGHALAFAHEHLRPDTPASCTASKSGTYGDTMPGAYDPVSIMNYCGDGIRLTSLDIHGAILMYGMDTALLMTAL